MIECNVFDVDIVVHETGLDRKLDVSYRTDLPCGTRVVCSVSRKYIDHHDNECEWRLFSATQDMEPSDIGDLTGNHLEIVIDKADRAALQKFNEDMTSYSSGIRGRVSDEIVVRLTVGARQTLKSFGRNNSSLVGCLVQASGGINIVRIERIVQVGMRNEYQPLTGPRPEDA